ncbi:MAG: reverse transcriptase domain-containing protein, partial [Brevinema sp.]
MNDEERTSLLELCKEYHYIFHLSNDQLTTTTAITHKIPLVNDTPVYVKSYRYPEVHKNEVRKQLQEMLDQKIIQPSQSPFSFPLWVVPKKVDNSGKPKWRIVVDYRKLNEKTISDAYPLPNIIDILDQLGRCNYFSTIDLASGFHQIPMDKSDISKTAFTGPDGHYEYLRMPFGLKTAPATFQRLMNTILTGLNGMQCFVYLDDIVVYSKTLKEHIDRLRNVFTRISENNLKLQPDKCEFLRKEVAYLGHIITSKGLLPNPEKIKAVKDYPVPKNVKDIQAFFGLAGYYRRFIKDFSKIVKPINKLLIKGTEFKWDKEQQNAFEYLKEKLTTAPLLQYPNFNRQFTLTTDASNYAIGSVLSQTNDNSDLPVAYASRTLNNTEINYSTIEKELLAIVWSVEHFRPYLYGRKFRVITDHKPLKFLLNTKPPASSRLMRWRLKLEEYDFEIIYKEGKTNLNADSLSRIKIDSYETFLESNPDKIIYNINEINGSIFNSKDNIIHCISKDLKMSKGLAQKIKNQIKNYNDLKKNKREISEFHISKNNNKLIFHLITKNKYYNKPKYEDIYYALKNLKEYLLKNNIKTISMPRIGCGLDQLSWKRIKQMIRFLFQNTNIIINAYNNNNNGNNTKQIFVTTRSIDKDEYNKFLQITENDVIENNNIIESDDFLLNKKNKNIAYPVSLDFHGRIPYCKEILENSLNPTELINSERELFNVITSKSHDNKQTYLHCFVKKNHFDMTSLHDIFITLQNLKNKLIETQIDNIAISNFCIDQISFNKFRLILQYLFKN